MIEKEASIHPSLNQAGDESRPELSRALLLEVAWEGEALRCVLAEEGPGAPTVLPRRLRSVDRAAVHNASAQIHRALQAAAYGRIDGGAGLERVRQAGRDLFDLLLDPETRSALLETEARYLTIKLDDRLADVPWELLHDGAQFLSDRFAVGRLVMTELPAPQSGRTRECRRRPAVAVFGGGGDDLGALWEETHGIDEALANHPYRVGVRLEATTGSFRQALRKAEVIHFSGHAEFDSQKPEHSALVFAHGERLTAEEIGHALAGVEKVPRLVFLNACGSGRSGDWTRECAKAAYGLGNAFLLRGVGHVIVTFCEVADGTSAQVGESFYSHLARGATIGEALQQARRRTPGQSSWAAGYALYGSPQATLQGEEYRTAVRAGFEPRRLPSGRTLSAFDRLRVDDYSMRQETQLLTLVLVEMLNAHGADPGSGDRDATERVEAFRRIVRQCLAEHPSMEEITCVGELFLIAAVKPSDAVRLALLVQSRVRKEAAPGAGSPGVRIALHLGEVAVKNPEDPGERRDLFGYQVDLANRVLGIAAPGQILMTRPVFDNARAILRDEDFPGAGAVSWLDHGAYRLRGVGEPVGICEAGEETSAPLAPPADSEKAHRYVAPDQEPVLGWRPAVDHPVPGTGWVLTEKLGEGGFGEVWLARHKTLGERRVFKFCFREDRVRTLKREATLFRLLREHVGEHPNIVKIQDVFFDEPPYYIAAEYVEGEDLNQWASHGDGLSAVPLKTRLEVAAQVADALQAAHEAGIIHRDVKPSNVIVTAPSDGEIRVRLTDFGIGHLVPRETPPGEPRPGFTLTFAPTDIASRIGTRLYMAPEVIEGRASSESSDLYSVGVLLWQLLVGDLSRALAADWGRELPKESRLAQPLLRRLLSSDPGNRPRQAGALAAELRNLPQKIARRRRLKITAVACLSVALLLGLLGNHAINHRWPARLVLWWNSSADLPPLERLKLETAAETEPSREAAENALEIIQSYEKESDWRSAEKWRRHLSRLLPDDPSWCNNMGWMLCGSWYAPGDAFPELPCRNIRYFHSPKTAVVFAAKANHLDPTDHYILDTLGWALHQAGENQEAAAVWNEFLRVAEVKQANVLGYLPRVAITFHSNQNAQEATETFYRFRYIFRGTDPVLQYLAEEVLNEPPPNVTELIRRIEMYPDNDSLFPLLSELFWASGGDRELCERVIREADLPGWAVSTFNSHLELLARVKSLRSTFVSAANSDFQPGHPFSGHVLSLPDGAAVRRDRGALTISVVSDATREIKQGLASVLMAEIPPRSFEVGIDIESIPQEAVFTDGGSSAFLRLVVAGGVLHFRYVQSRFLSASWKDRESGTESEYYLLRIPAQTRSERIRLSVVYDAEYGGAYVLVNRRLLRIFGGRQEDQEAVLSVGCDLRGENPLFEATFSNFEIRTPPEMVEIVRTRGSLRSEEREESLSDFLLARNSDSPEAGIPNLHNTEQMRWGDDFDGSDLDVTAPLPAWRTDPPTEGLYHGVRTASGYLQILSRPPGDSWSAGIDTGDPEARSFGDFSCHTCILWHLFDDEPEGILSLILHSGTNGFCRVLYDLNQEQFRLEQNWNSEEKVLGSVNRTIEKGTRVFLSVSCKGQHIRARVGTSAGGSEIAEWVVRSAVSPEGGFGFMSSDCNADVLFDYVYVGDPEWNPFGEEPAVFTVHGVGRILNPSFEEGGLVGWDTFKEANRLAGTMEKINDPVHGPHPQSVHGKSRASMSWGAEMRQVGGGLYQTVTGLTPHKPLHVSVKMSATASSTSGLENLSSAADKIGLFWIDAGEADFSSGLPREARRIAYLPLESRDKGEWSPVEGKFVPTGDSVIIGAFWNFNGDPYALMAVHLDDWQLAEAMPGETEDTLLSPAAGGGLISNPSYEDGNLMGWETFREAGKQAGTMELINDAVHMPTPETAHGRFCASMSWGRNKRMVGGGLYQVVTGLTPNRPVDVSSQMYAAATSASGLENFSNASDRIGLFWIDAGEADFSSGLPREAQWIVDLPLESRDKGEWSLVEGKFVPTGDSVIIGAYWNFMGAPYALMGVRLDDWHLEQQSPRLAEDE